MVSQNHPSEFSLFDESRLTLSQAAKKLGKSPSTLWRWSLKGVRGVILETYVEGSQRYTSEQALNRFREHCTVAANGDVPLVRTSNQRQREVERAERDLAREGI